jgi:hypothetical protein
MGERRLAESEHYAIDHEFEVVFVVEKATGRKFSLDAHYGDPHVALIAPDESWFAAAGEGVTFYDHVRGLSKFLRDESEQDQNPARLHYIDPATGSERSVEGYATAPHEPVFVSAIRLTEAGDLEITGEWEGQHWRLNPVTLDLTNWDTRESTQ